HRRGRRRTRHAVRTPTTPTREGTVHRWPGGRTGVRSTHRGAQRSEPMPRQLPKNPEARERARACATHPWRNFMMSHVTAVNRVASCFAFVTNRSDECFEERGSKGGNTGVAGPTRPHQTEGRLRQTAHRNQGHLGGVEVFVPGPAQQHPTAPGRHQAQTVSEGLHHCFVMNGLTERGDGGGTYTQCVIGGSQDRDEWHPCHVLHPHLCPSG